MTTTVIANGHTYTDDDNPNTGMGAGGFRVRLLPMLSDVMHDTSASQTAAASSAAAAAASATSAVNAPGTNSTSTTSLAVTIASKSLTTQTGKLWAVGAFVVLARTSAPTTTWMFGQITAYTTGTGAMTVNVTRALGSGSAADWTITLSAPAAKDVGGYSSFSVPTTVTATSNKLQELVAPINLANLTLGSGVPTGSASVPGPAVFGVRNSAAEYAVDLAVSQGFASTQLGYLPAGRSASIDSAGSGGWKSADLLSYGSDVKAQVAFSSAVAGTGGVWTKFLELANGTTLVLVYGASLHAVIFDPATGFGTPALVRSGLSTVGGEATVMATVSLVDPTIVMICSCPDSGTALQSVILAMSGTSITLGLVSSTSLGAAAVRLVDLRPVVNSLGSSTFVVTALSSTNTLFHYGLILPVGTGNITVGAVRTETTTSSFAASLTSFGVADVYMSATSTATLLTVRAVTINPTTGTQTVGSSATQTVTSASNIFIREQSGLTGNAIGVTFVNTLPKMVSLSITGTTPAFTSVAALTSAITTMNTYGVSEFISNNGYAMGAAVSGTDSSGRFLSEISQWDMGASPPALLNSLVTVTMSAAHTVVWVGVSPSVLATNIWQLLSATELVVANSQVGASYPNTQRLNGLGQYAQPLLAPEANYPRFARPRTTNFSGHHAMAITDGAKPSLDYAFDYATATPTQGPVSYIASLAFSQVVRDDTSQVVANGTWLAAGPAPASTLVLQRTRIV